MNLGIIGCGAIGTDVAKAADAMKEIEHIYLYDSKVTASSTLMNSLKKAEVKTVQDFLPDVDVVVESASQQAVEEYGIQVLQAGKHLIIMSIGSLFNDTLKKELSCSKEMPGKR